MGGAKAVEKVKRSKARATCARAVLLFSDGWEGPRPGLVLCDATDAAILDGDESGNQIDVNIGLHGHRDACILEMCRQLHTGSTISGVPLYDALGMDETSRAAAIAQSPVTWGEMRVIAEWPPRN